MKKIVIYGSHLCDGCTEVKKFLSERGTEYAYFDISLELGALKRFLKIRDTSPLFDEIKKNGRIGIPTLLIGDEIVTDFDREKIERLLAE